MAAKAPFQPKPEVNEAQMQLRDNRSTETKKTEGHEGICGQREHQYMDEIPALVIQPKLETMPCDACTDEDKILFDLETTGLGTWDEITQVAAEKGGQTFNRYVLPERSISAEAAAVTGLTVETTAEGTRILVHNGERVNAKPIKNVLSDFIDWLKFIQGSRGSMAILCAHNVKFDMRFLLTAATRCNLFLELQSVIGGFMDTLPSFKQFLKGRKSYSQQKLYTDIVKKDFDEAHNAMADVLALKELLTVSEIPFDVLSLHTYTFHSAIAYVTYLKEKNDRLMTLKNPLSFLTKNMQSKIAASGLNYSNLKLAFVRGGEEGLIDLLVEPVPGSRDVRVTRRKEIQSRICTHFQEQNIENIEIKGYPGCPAHP